MVYCHIYLMLLGGAKKSVLAVLSAENLSQPVQQCLKRPVPDASGRAALSSYHGVTQASCHSHFLYYGLVKVIMSS